MKKKIKLKKKKGKNTYLAGRDSNSLNKNAVCIVWEIGKSGSKASAKELKSLKTDHDWNDAVGNILKEITAQVIQAVDDANGDTRITFSRASNTC